MVDYCYDASHVRYQLVAKHEGMPYNWLFLPGGLGADSSYLQSLVSLLELPGNVWLVDFPGNGSNTESIPADYDYNEWFALFPPMVQRFENPIIVGHSAGGMFPLCFPELEKKLKGFVVLNAAPSLWLADAVAYAEQFHLPDLTQEMADFTQTPNEATFTRALGACMPYYFPPHSLEKGRALLTPIPFPFLPAVWWQHKVAEINFSAKWIPETVPTLIIGGRYDCICPFPLFRNDVRFKRPNIEMIEIGDGGHLPWIENPEAVKTAFKNFCKQLGDL